MTVEEKVWMDQLKIQVEALLHTASGTGRLYHQALAIKLTLKELENTLDLR